MKTIKKSEVQTIRVHKTKPPAGEIVRIQIARHFGCILAPYWCLDGFFFVIFEPTVLRLVSSSFTQKLCAISNTERRNGSLNNKILALRVHFVLTVWLQVLFAGNQNAHGWSSRKEDENREIQADKCEPRFIEAKPAFQPDSGGKAGGWNPRLQSLRCRLDHAKSLLGIDRKTSSTQNADLLERLLNCFELVMP